MMFARNLFVGTLLFAAVASAGEAPKAPEPKAPAFAEIEAVVRPMLADLELTADQKAKAEAVLTEEVWKKTVEAFDGKRGREIFRAAHEVMRKTMPTVMMPRMMAYNMKKTMQERMAKKAGPPKAEEIAAIRDKMRKKMQGRIGPKIMGGLEELAAERMQEILADKKVLVRVLGDKVAAVALTAEQKPKLDKALAAAGSPASLVQGPDAVLIERMKKMLEKVADEAVAELKAEDAAAKKAAEAAKKAQGAEF